ncbi:MAG: plasmid mobilization protein [Methylobacter sp.]
MAKRSLAVGEKSKTISFRLSESDAEALLNKVEASGLSMSEFVREYVLKNRTSVIARTPASRDKLSLIRLFNKTGNNINQLAKSINIAFKSGKVSEVNYLALLSELQHISRYMKGCIKDVD